MFFLRHAKSNELSVSVRHRIAHAYFDLDWQILWTSAKEDVPELGARVAEILRNDFGNELTALDDPA
jgi:uncharacterized protein with HEPN domain